MSGLEKTNNYTKEQLSQLIELYEEFGTDGIEQIANTIGKPVRSIRSKLVHMGIYVPVDKASAKKIDGPAKKELLRALEALNFDVTGFEGATKNALSRLLGLVQQS